MIEQLIAFVLGFVTAYLVVKAIRAFRTLGMCLMVGLLINTVKAGNLTMINNDPNASHTVMLFYSYGSWVFDTVSANLAPNETLSVDKNFSNGILYCLAWGAQTSHADAGVVRHDHFTGTGGQMLHTSYFNEVYQYTNYNGTVYLTNSTVETVSYQVRIIKTSDQSVVHVFEVPLRMYSSYSKDFTLPYPWKWDSQLLFHWNDEGEPVNGPGGTNNTPTPTNDNVPATGNPAPVPPQTPSPSHDMIHTNYPGSPLATNLPIQQVERENTMSLLDLISKLKQTMETGNQIARTNGIGQTNIDYRPYWTNTLLNQTNMLGPDAQQITNDWSTNTGYYEALATNLLGSEYSNVWATQTNFSTFLANTNLGVATQMVVALGTVGGVTHQIDFDLDRVKAWSSVLADMLLICDWAGKLLGWAIALGLWAYCTYRIDELVAELEIAARSHMGGSLGGGSISGTAIKYVARMFTRGMVAAAIWGFVTVLPTMCMAFMTQFWVGEFVSPQNMVNPVAQINSNAMGLTDFAWNQAKYWWSVLGRSLPFGVMITAIVNWFAFFVYSRSIARFCARMIWAKSYLAPCLVLCLFSVTSQASEVQWENYSGVDVVASNSTERIVIPVGVTKRMVMDAGQWSVGTNTLTIGEDTFNCVRILKRKDNDELSMVQSGNGLTALACYFLGMKTGFVIFFCSWSVRMLIDGLRLRHGHGV